MEVATVKNRFAYLFEDGNYQLLVQKTVNEDDEPKLSFITEYDGIEIDLGIVFNNEDALDEAFGNHKQIKSGAEEYLSKLNASSSLKEFLSLIRD